MEFQKGIVTFKTPMADKAREAMELYEKHGAFLKGHFKMRGEQHTNIYAESDLVLPHTLDVFKMAFYMAQPFVQDGIEVVVATAPKGIILQTAIAYWLSTWTNSDVIGIYAEKDDYEFYIDDNFKLIENPSQLFIRENHRHLIQNKKNLLVDDILSSKNGTLYRMSRKVRECGGTVAGATVIINRGAVTAEDIGIPKLHAVAELTLPTFTPGKNSCPGCNASLPLNK